MESRPFMLEKEPPMDASLKKAMGKCYVHYLELLKKTSEFQSAWSFSKSSGWMLKIFDRKKALFYIIPLNNAMRINLTLREAERMLLLSNTVLTNFHPPIKDAKRYSEGYALFLIIHDTISAVKVIDLISAIIATRSKSENNKT